MKAKYFSIQEYVPPHIYEARGNKAWQLIDSRLIEMNDLLREEFGPMIINTWHSERLQAAYGLRQWSGLRDIEFYREDWMLPSDLLKAFSTKFSQHIYGRASDALFRDATVEDVRQTILANPEKYKYINAIEEGVSWLHGDVRNCARIMTFGA